MIINKITVAYFSPTGNVKKTALKIGEASVKVLHNRISDDPEETGLSASEDGSVFAEFDFLTPKARSCFTGSFASDELLVIGLPVYAGRLPNKILPFVQQAFKGKDTPCIPFVCFGNRSFGDALSELVSEMRSNGFIVCGGAAIVSEHSFCPELATGRPDEQDLMIIKEYALKICKKVLAAKDKDALRALDRALVIPGNMPPEHYYTPLKEDGTPAVFLKAKPVTDTEKCDRCMKCMKVCPFASISHEDPSSTQGICIKCQACIKACHTGAKFFDDEDFLSHRANLAANYTERKENIFLYIE